MAQGLSSQYFEGITGEIVFAHLTASLCHCIVLPNAQHQSRKFVPHNPVDKLAFDYSKRLLIIDKHPHIRFESLEADLFFRFSFNKNLQLDIPSNLQGSLFILGEHQSPIYTTEEKLIDTIMVDHDDVATTLFPDTSPANINNDSRLWSYDPATTFHHRYCVFESTLDTSNYFRKLLQLERLIAYYTARHFARLIKCRSSALSRFPPNFAPILHNVKTRKYDKITDRDMPIIMMIMLSCIGFAGFSMPANMVSSILTALNNDNIGNPKEKCNFFFLNTLLKTGRLLFYFVNNTEQGWRLSILSSMAIICERMGTIESVQQSIQKNVNELTHTKRKRTNSIEEICTSPSTATKDRTNKNMLESLNTFKNEIDDNFNELQIKIDRKLDELETDINTKVDRLQTKFREKIKELGCDIDNRLERMHASTTKRVNEIKDLNQSHTTVKDRSFCVLL